MLTRPRVMGPTADQRRRSRIALAQPPPRPPTVSGRPTRCRPAHRQPKTVCVPWVALTEATATDSATVI